MEEFARRLMLQGHRATSSLPAAIFGTVGDLQAVLELNKPRLRVGIWPFVSSTAPQTALGMAAAIALLLERYRDVRVYRLLAQLEGEPATYQWNIDQSQFDVDDWQLDDLDENIAIWGKLEPGDGLWKLEVHVENDMFEEDDSLKMFTYQAASPGDLMQQIVTIAADIATFIEAEDLKIIAPLYTQSEWNDTVMQQLAAQLFNWELKLYLSLWGKPWDTLTADKNDLILAGKGAGEFGAWMVSRSIGRALVVTDKEVSESILPLVNDAMVAFPDSLFPAIYLGGALYESGNTQAAYELMEGAIQEHDEDAEVYLALGELYRAGGRPGDAVSIYQEIIESDLATSAIYLRYADLVLAMDYNNFFLEDYVMIDADEIVEERMTYEAIEAFQTVLTEEPNHIEALARQLTQFVELGKIDPRFWPGFRQLVQLDDTGERVRALVDGFYNLEDLAPAFTILKDAAGVQSERYDLALNLAVAYLADEQGDAAITHLERARKLTADPLIHAEIDRLMLAAQDPDFDMRMGEITDVVSAGNALESDDVEFLEMAIEQAPSFAEGYLFLAKAYIAWDEPATAIETLLDGHKQLPDDPDIALLLAQTLWSSGEHASAFGYLNKALTKSPTHVPLLAVTGQYLFEDGQEDAARAYLARAELISPNNPVLNEVRIFISRMID